MDIKVCDYCQGDVEPAGDLYFCCNCGKKFNIAEFKALREPHNALTAKKTPPKRCNCTINHGTYTDPVGKARCNHCYGLR